MRNILLLLPLLLLQACNSSDKPILAPEAIYDEPGMSIITTFFNTDAKTTSSLYGNTPAIATAHDVAGVLQHGAQYRLVTWRQKENPLWFGGNISDSIQAVERLIVLITPGSQPSLRYNVSIGKVMEDPAIRTKFILGLRGLEFPSVTLD